MKRKPPRKRKPARKPPRRASSPVRHVEPTEFQKWEAGLTQRERWVEDVVQRMSAGRWLSGVSHRERAEAWGVTPGTVEHIAAEANRTIRRLLRTDDEGRLELRARICQTIESIQVRAIGDGTPNGLRTALQATELLGRYWGVEPPKTVVMQPKGEFEGLSDEEVAAIGRGDDDGRTDDGTGSVRH